MAYLKLLLIVATTFAFAARAQVKGVVIAKPNADTTILPGETSFKVRYVDTTSTTTPAFYLNGTFVPVSVIRTINPALIQNLDIKQDHVVVDGINYPGQVYIKTKNNYTPKFSSLVNFKLNHTNLQNKPAVFSINGEIISGDYNNYLVDLNEVLSVSVDKLSIPTEQVDVALIKILTRSEENIKKSKQIMIRGTSTNLE